MFAPVLQADLIGSPVRAHLGTLFEHFLTAKICDKIYVYIHCYKQHIGSLTDSSNFLVLDKRLSNIVIVYAGWNLSLQTVCIDSQTNLFAFISL